MNLNEVVSYMGSVDSASLLGWILALLIGLVSFVSGLVNTVKTTIWSGKKIWAALHWVASKIRSEPSELGQKILEKMESESPSFGKRHRGDKHPHVIECGSVCILLPYTEEKHSYAFKVWIDDVLATESLTACDCKLIREKAKRLQIVMEECDQQMAVLEHLDRLDREKKKPA